MDFLYEMVGGDLKELNSVVVMWCGDYVKITNHIKIITFSSEKVVLKTKNNLLNVEGENITIANMEPNELLLKGKIRTIYYEKL